MTVDALIERLQKLKKNPDQLEVNIGQLQVRLVCPVADNYCWIHEEDVTVDDSVGVVVVKLQGGFGA